MNIVVIGGSYFYGRVFTMLASKEHQLVLLNRGTYSMEQFGVKQILFDRQKLEDYDKIPEQLAQMMNPEEGYAVVDFCGYGPGDIKELLKVLPGKVTQYIFISTVDVYERNGHLKKSESEPLEERILQGDVGGYIYGKVCLEKELKEAAANYQMPYTILRPAILYGPFNYAPREAYYIEQIVKGAPVYEPEHAPGQFQFVYVKDAANAILNALGNPKVYNEAIHLAGEEILTYQVFFDALEKVADRPFTREKAALANIFPMLQSGEASFPFPLLLEESETFDNTKSHELLKLSYTPLIEGMQKTYTAFKGVYS